MAVKIRLERCGCRNRPFYRIIAADSKSPRDGKLIQVLGFYDPLAGKDENKHVVLNSTEYSIGYQLVLNLQTLCDAFF